MGKIYWDRINCIFFVKYSMYEKNKKVWWNEKSGYGALNL